MEGTTPNNTNQNILDEVINEIFESAVESGSEKDLEIALRLIDAWNNDFTGEGEDITDKLPTLDEAIKLREENEKLKEHKLNREEQLTKIADIVGYGFPNIDNNNKLIDMIEKLKEENEAWHAMDGGDGDEVFGNRLWSLLYEKKLSPTSYGEAVGFIKDLFEENEKLKEEIATLKESLIT